MFEIVGIKRTSKSFLDGIQKMSGEKKTAVVEKLRKLKVFSTITETKHGVSVTEERRSISFRGDTTKDTPKGYFKLRLPNLFARAENLEMSLSTSGDTSFKFTKPVVCGSLSFFSVCGSKDTKKAPDEEYLHTYVSLEVERENEEISVGREKIGCMSQVFLEARKAFPPFNVKVKTGVSDFNTSKGFVKTQVNTLLSKNFPRSLFASFSLTAGAIFGNPHITERYHLGENIRGYKNMSISPKSSGFKVGGKSFVEAIHRLGMHAGDATVFLFGSLGYVSEGNNVVNTLRSAANACSHRNSECLGISAGMGINVPIMKAKNGPVVGMSFAIPLTSNKQVQRLQFGFDMDF